MEFGGGITEDGEVGGCDPRHVGVEGYDGSVDGVSRGGVGDLELEEEGGKVCGGFLDGIGGRARSHVRELESQFQQSLHAGSRLGEEGDNGRIVVEEGEEVGVGEEDVVEVGEGEVFFVKGEAVVDKGGDGLGEWIEIVSGDGHVGGVIEGLKVGKLDEKFFGSF